MKTNKYWEKRSGQRLLDSLKDADKMLDTLDTSYEKAIANINNKISILYGRFADENGVSINKAQEIIQSSEYRHWRYSMEEYLRRIENGDEVLVLELNVLCMRPRINRLEAIEGEILANCAMLAKNQEIEATKQLTKVLENTYYNNMYDQYKDSNPRILELMDRHQVKLSKSDIEAVLRLPWSGENYSKRIWRREFNVAHKVKELVTQNILAGTSIDNLTRQVTNELGKDYENSAKRLIRTETAYVKGQGDLLTYNKLGVDEYQFSSVLDTKTSKPCRRLDGKVFKAEDAQVGVNYPPMHPNCRSITIKAKDKRDGTRAARDKHGRSIEVPADMTYKEWYKAYVESD